LAVLTLIFALLRPSAFRAKPEERQMIYSRRETVTAADARPQWLHEIIVELRHVATAMTDEVVMRFVDQLELACPPTEVGHTDQTEIAEELQRAIDGRTIDRW